MPLDITRDPDRPYVVVVLPAEVDAFWLVDALVEVRDRVGEEAGYDQLWDARNVEVAEVSPDFLDAIDALVEMRQAHGLDIRGRRAVVSADPVLHDIVHSVAAHVERYGVEVRAFEDYDGAAAWLDPR